MNAADVNRGNAKRKLLEPAASPLPFAVRARRSTPLLSTCLRPAGAGDSNQSTEPPLRTRLLPASLLAPGQPWQVHSQSMPAAPEPLRLRSTRSYRHLAPPVSPRHTLAALPAERDAC